MTRQKPRANVWSYGGGTQSVAIAALIIQGRLPKPDYAVIADTGMEKQSTWDYMDNVTNPALKSIGLANPASVELLDVSESENRRMVGDQTEQTGRI